MSNNYDRAYIQTSTSRMMGYIEVFWNYDRTRREWEFTAYFEDLAGGTGGTVIDRWHSDGDDRTTAPVTAEEYLKIKVAEYKEHAETVQAKRLERVGYKEENDTTLHLAARVLEQRLNKMHRISDTLGVDENNVRLNALVQAMTDASVALLRDDEWGKKTALNYLKSVLDTGVTFAKHNLNDQRQAMLDEINRR